MDLTIPRSVRSTAYVVIQADCLAVTHNPITLSRIPFTADGSSTLRDQNARSGKMFNFGSIIHINVSERKGPTGILLSMHG